MKERKKERKRERKKKKERNHYNSVIIYWPSCSSKFVWLFAECTGRSFHAVKIITSKNEAKETKYNKHVPYDLWKHI